MASRSWVVSSFIYFNSCQSKKQSTLVINVSKLYGRQFSTKHDSRVEIYNHKTE